MAPNVHTRRNVVGCGEQVINPFFSLSHSLSFFILFPCRAFLPSCLPPFHLRHSFVPLIFMSPTRNVAEGRIMARRRRRGERRRTEETSEQRARALPPPSSWARYRSAAMIGLVQVWHENERQVGEKKDNLEEVEGVVLRFRQHPLCS